MDKRLISIVEMFKSIQGEGLNTGVPYAFVRTGGCPLRCNFCDSSYTFQPGTKSIIPVDDVIGWCLQQDVTWVSITGGEPLVFKEQLRDILNRLRIAGYKTHVETSGRYYDEVCHELSALWSPDVKTPCTGEQDEKWIDWLPWVRDCDQVKCVIRDEVDLDYAYSVNVALNGRCTMVLQPFNELALSTQGPNSLMALRNYLIERFKWLTEEILSPKRVWRRVMVSQQSHVLLWGNKPGT